MGWYILLGTLAAYGALSGGWALLGGLLPGLRGCAVVYWGKPDEGICHRYRWLRGLGLMNCPLIAVTQDAQTEDMEACSREELLERLKWEAERFDRTGA